ncbi:MAG: hypothetical protein PVJ80_17425 [Gemmatimonadota bacterium]
MAELILMAMVGLSILTVSVGFTVRVFMGPVLRDVAERLANKAKPDDGIVAARLDLLDDRLAALESGLERIEAAQDFERRLGTVDARKSETA